MSIRHDNDSALAQATLESWITDPDDRGRCVVHLRDAETGRMYDATNPMPRDSALRWLASWRARRVAALLGEPKGLVITEDDPGGHDRDNMEDDAANRIETHAEMMDRNDGYHVC